MIYSFLRYAYRFQMWITNRDSCQCGGRMVDNSDFGWHYFRCDRCAKKAYFF